MVHAMGLKSKAKFACNCHEQNLRRIYAKNKWKAFEKKLATQKNSREYFLKSPTVARRGKVISEEFKFHYCHKITKLIKKRILHDTMILVTTPQKHQVR